MRAAVNKAGKIDIFADKQDICFDCEIKSDCPLIEALRAEIVILRYEDVDISRCGLFRKRLNNVKN